MTRARGANATMKLAFENIYGTPPAIGSYFSAPFVSSQLGAERPLIDSDLLGQGREMQDPTLDVVTNDGDLVVPVDARNLWLWLKLMFGPPADAAVVGETGFYDHVFTSGAADLPSASIEIGFTDAGIYAMHDGAKANQLKISMQRSGLLNATLSMICKGEAAPAVATIDPNSVELAISRFAQATGQVLLNGAAIATIVKSDLTLSNNLDKVETISPDGEISGADPAMFGVTGSVDVKYDSTTFDTMSIASTPVSLVYKWTNGNHTLTLTIPRVYLPRVKKPITGPAGVQASYNFSASGSVGHAAVVTLRNDTQNYAGA